LSARDYFFSITSGFGGETVGFYAFFSSVATFFSSGLELAPKNELSVLLKKPPVLSLLLPELNKLLGLVLKIEGFSLEVS
jgi:hypothetical protein